MPQVAHAIVINASPERVWLVVGDLTSTPHWWPGVASVDIRGATRISELTDGGRMIEEIGFLSDARATYTFRLTRPTRAPREVSGSFALAASAEGGTVVFLEASFEAAAGPGDGEAQPRSGPSQQRSMALAEGVDTGDLAEVDALVIGVLESLRRWIERRERWDGVASPDRGGAAPAGGSTATDVRAWIDRRRVPGSHARQTCGEGVATRREGRHHAKSGARLPST